MSHRRVPSGVRLLLAVVVSLLVMTLAAIGAVAAALHELDAGMIEVAVEPAGGGRVDVVVPCALARAAIALVPESVVEEVAREIEREVGPAWPAVGAALEGLAEHPDVVLVEVRSRQGSVLVAKRGDALRIEVADRGDRVDVSVPLDALAALVHRLEP